MNKSKFLFVALFVSITAICVVQNATAQVNEKIRSESNYSVVLQAVIGSKDAVGRSDLPSNLTEISKQFKKNYTFSSYRLADTFTGRIGDSGTFEYKSVSNLLGPEVSGDLTTFMEWSVVGLKGASGGLQARAFRFGARVPIATGNTKDETGKISPVINYESIGLTMTTFGVPENIPTLVGTLTLPKSNGTMFLVMTISSADR